MKSIRFAGLLLILLIPALGFISLQTPTTHTSQSLSFSMVGAWVVSEVNGQVIPEGAEVKTVRIISEDYTMFTTYNLKEKQFMGTGGGSWKLEGNNLTGKIDFETSDTTLIGTSYSYTLDMPDENTFIAEGKSKDKPLKVTMKRIDDSSNEMAGAYRISGRYRDGEMKESRPGPRKTIKMLSGTRFQWAAINAKTKKFYGTGGGTYTLEDGKYTEHIEFFSRDGSRVGASLGFEASLEGDDWSHKGKSSKGKPIHEIWTRNWNLHD